MTTPEESRRAVERTRDFLYRLSDPSKTKRIPLTIRKEARSMLRHYPYPCETTPVTKQQEPS